MNVISRILSLAICVCFSASTFGANTFQNGNVATVKHFNATTLKWDEESIPGLDSVSNIYSAGKYAWANNHQNKVAFFDGTKWSASILIPNMTYVASFAPAYPLTGKAPTAWALGEDVKRNIYLAYFNGSSWSTVATGLNAGDGSLILNASAGYGWLQSNKDVFRPVFYRLTPNEPLKMQVIKGIDYSRAARFISPDSFNDATPYYFIGRHVIFETEQLLRVDASGNIKTIELKNMGDSDNGIVTFVKGNNVVALTMKNGQMYIYESRDNGLTWKNSPPAPHIIFSGNNFHQVYTEGVLYADTQAGDPSSVDRFVLSFNEATPTWQSVSIPGEFNSLFQIMTDAEGVWLFGQDVDRNFKLFRYDVATKKLKDADLNSVLHDKMMAGVATIDKNQLLVCNEDQDRRLTAYYFNNNTWSAEPLNFDNRGCQFNVIGGSEHSMKTLDKNSVWIY